MSGSYTTMEEGKGHNFYTLRLCQVVNMSSPKAKSGLTAYGLTLQFHHFHSTLRPRFSRVFGRCF